MRGGRLCVQLVQQPPNRRPAPTFSSDSSPPHDSHPCSGFHDSVRMRVLLGIAIFLDRKMNIAIGHHGRSPPPTALRHGRTAHASASQPDNLTHGAALAAAQHGYVDRAHALPAPHATGNGTPDRPRNGLRTAPSVPDTPVTATLPAEPAVLQSLPSTAPLHAALERSPPAPLTAPFHSRHTRRSHARDS